MRAIAGILLAFLAVAVLLVLFAPSFAARSTAYEQYVCTRCGLEKLEDARKVSSLVYHRRVTFEDSAVSRALKVKECPHNWLLFRYGYSVKRFPFRNGFFADGGFPSDDLQLILRDEAFAQELARIQTPAKSWGLLVTDLKSNRAFVTAFSSWYEDPDRGPFSDWATTNGFWNSAGP
jgi:hypothetical protein